MRRRYYSVLIGSAGAVILFLLSTVDQNDDGRNLGEVTCVPEKIQKESNTVKSSVIHCHDKKLDFSIEQRGEFFIFYNYFVANKQFKCYEAVTYTTHGDVTFLDNLGPLVERWDGPISVSMYAPGEDFKLTIESIAYLRNCGNSLTKELVSFHLFFEGKFTPKDFKKSLINNTVIYKNEFNCTQSPPYSTIDREDLFKTKNNLLYPINIARNSARTAAQTYFVLASDMELYPTPNFSLKFIEMVSKKNEQLFADGKQPRVFVLPVFEVTKDSSIPENKTVLKGMIKTKRAFIFHEKLCRSCHIVPSYNEWIKASESSDLNIFTMGKRSNKYAYWEPFFVGTNKDPLFDERLTWEGQSNKMTQNYIQCLLDYDYMILDNAFLVHRPGIKKSKEQLKKHFGLVTKTNKLLKNVIKRELSLLYGNRTGCKLL